MQIARIWRTFRLLSEHWPASAGSTVRMTAWQIHTPWKIYVSLTQHGVGVVRCWNVGGLILMIKWILLFTNNIYEGCCEPKLFKVEIQFKWHCHQQYLYPHHKDKNYYSPPFFFFSLILWQSFVLVVAVGKESVVGFSVVFLIIFFFSILVDFSESRQCKTLYHIQIVLCPLR